MGSYSPYIGAGLGLLGTGASIYSGIQGKENQQQQTEALQRLAQSSQGASQGLLNLTEPLRTGVMAPLVGVLAGGRPENFRVFAPEREALEAQFGRAREAIIGTSGARGGQLTRGLMDLEKARAQGIGGLEADVRNRALNLGAQIGFQVPGVAFGGMNQAANMFGNLANQAGQQATMAGQGLGQLASIGTLLALKQGQGGGGGSTPTIPYASAYGG